MQKQNSALDLNFKKKKKVIPLASSHASEGRRRAYFSDKLSNDLIFSCGPHTYRHHNNVHGDDDHPEDPRRIWRIYDAIRNAHCTDRMIKITSREATVDELGLVHTDNHIENITKTSGTVSNLTYGYSNKHFMLRPKKPSKSISGRSCWLDLLKFLFVYDSHVKGRSAGDGQQLQQYLPQQPFGILRKAILRKSHRNLQGSCFGTGTEWCRHYPSSWTSRRAT